MPTSPASAPDSSIVTSVMRFASMPLATAALGDSPVARRSKPNRLRETTSQYRTPTTAATSTKPPSRVPCGGSTPNARSTRSRFGKRALSGSSGVRLLLLPSTFSCRCSASR